MSLKRKIKSILPDRIIYFYSILQLTPKYILASKRNQDIPDIKFHSNEQTVAKIVHERKSLSRFGDGEFMWMSGEKLNSFQESSTEFVRDLTAAFTTKNDNLLIGIPYGVFDASKCNIYARMHWKTIRSNFLTRMLPLVDLNRVYCDASITRPYIDYRNREFSERIFILLKKIWENRDVVVVEGEKTKLGIGNDLLNNSKSVRRIICPAVNAYSKLEDIKESIRLNVSKDMLILGALGPTASILAAQMCEEGYQFVDIGHVDVEYMWFLNRAILREPIQGKHVNESGIFDHSDYYDNDPSYQNSIIFRIK